MNELEERARRLVDAARPGHDPTAADAARVRAALQARVLAEPLLIQPSPAPAAASGVLGKVAIALGVGGSLGFAAGLYAAQALWPGMLARSVEADVGPVATTAHAGPVATTARAVTDASASAARSAAPAGVERAPDSYHDATLRTENPPAAAALPAPRPSSRGNSGSSVPAVSALEAELDGLRRAQELLHQGRPAWAIARLDELDRAGVGSVLLEERAATRAIAQCRLGAGGTAQADDYARRFPRSAHLERVRASCAAAPQLGASPSGAGTSSAKLAPAQTESRGSSHEK